MTPAIDSELLRILCCPETAQPLAPIDSEELRRINSLIGAGRICNRKGNLVQIPAHGGLVRQDMRVLYLVREGVPVLLREEGILLDAIGER